MADVVTCPTCSFRDFDITDYSSCTVLGEEYALFTFTCPQCGTRLPAVCRIPMRLRAQIARAAREAACGMGQGH